MSRAQRAAYHRAEYLVANDGERLTLAPVRKRYSLAQLLRGMKPGDMPSDTDWEADKAVGREVW